MPCASGAATASTPRKEVDTRTLLGLIWTLRALNSSRPPDVHHSGFPSVGILRIYFNEIEPSRRLERHEATIVFAKVRLRYKTRNGESSRADLNVSNQAYAWRTCEKGRRDREYNADWREGTRGARILEARSYGYCKLRTENQYVGDPNVLNRIRAIYGAPERAGTSNVADPQCAKRVARVCEARAVTQRPVCAERQHGAQAELNVAPENKVFQAYDHRGSESSKALSADSWDRDTRSKERGGVRIELGRRTQGKGELILLMLCMVLSRGCTEGQGFTGLARTIETRGDEHGHIRLKIRSAARVSAQTILLRGRRSHLTTRRRRQVARESVSVQPREPRSVDIVMEGSGGQIALAWSQCVAPASGGYTNSSRRFRPNLNVSNQAYAAAREGERTRASAVRVSRPAPSARSRKASRRRGVHAKVQHHAKLGRARRCVRGAHVSDGRDALHFQAKRRERRAECGARGGVITSRRESRGQYHHARSTRESQYRAQVELKALHGDGDERRLDAHPALHPCKWWSAVEEWVHLDNKRACTDGPILEPASPGRVMTLQIPARGNCSDARSPNQEAHREPQVHCEASQRSDGDTRAQFSVRGGVQTRHGERQDESRPGYEHLDAACTPNERDPPLRGRHEMKGCRAKGYHASALCVDTRAQYGAQHERRVLEGLQSGASSGTECCADEHHPKSRPSSTWSSSTDARLQSIEMAGAPPRNAGTTCARRIAALQICTSRRASAARALRWRKCERCQIAIRERMRTGGDEEAKENEAPPDSPNTQMSRSRSRRTPGMPPCSQQTQRGGIACTTRTAHPCASATIVLVQRAPEVSQEDHERAPCRGSRVGWSFLVAFFARTQKCKRKRRAQQLAERHPHAAGCNEREACGNGEGGACGGDFGSCGEPESALKKHPAPGEENDERDEAESGAQSNGKKAHHGAQIELYIRISVEEAEDSEDVGKVDDEALQSRSSKSTVGLRKERCASEARSKECARGEGEDEASRDDNTRGTFRSKGARGTVRASREAVAFRMQGAPQRFALDNVLETWGVEECSSMLVAVATSQQRRVNTAGRRRLVGPLSRMQREQASAHGGDTHSTQNLPSYPDTPNPRPISQLMPARVLCTKRGWSWE
ncbi:hypothetical protein B0H14DRAFT_2594145 [Mycena olivaceomarginata]|nr:hypothetical protein B0H14DRAFT_2594145 [Mycena olivaceomarginata]